MSHTLDTSNSSLVFGRVLISSILLMTSIHCGDIGLEMKTLAKVTVYVHWGDTPIPQKKVELVQTGEVKLTDENGLAVFEVPPGKYVIRVYGINRGGPVSLYVDFDVDLTLSPNQTLSVVDCIPCV